MLLMTLFDALAVASNSFDISFFAHAYTHHLVLHYSARYTCFSCCFKNFLKIHWNTPREVVVLCAQNNCQSQPSVDFGSSLQHELASPAEVLTLSCDLVPPKRSQPAV